MRKLVTAILSRIFRRSRRVRALRNANLPADPASAKTVVTVTFGDPSRAIVTLPEKVKIKYPSVRCREEHGECRSPECNEHGCQL